MLVPWSLLLAILLNRARCTCDETIFDACKDTRRLTRTNRNTVSTSLSQEIVIPFTTQTMHAPLTELDVQLEQQTTLETYV